MFLFWIVIEINILNLIKIFWRLGNFGTNNLEKYNFPLVNVLIIFNFKLIVASSFFLIFSTKKCWLRKKRRFPYTENNNKKKKRSMFVQPVINALVNCVEVVLVFG